MADRIIGSTWESYRDRVLPHDAPDTQVSECRLAFYAGAKAMFVAFTEASALEEARAVRILEGVGAELQEFVANAAGRS